MKKGHIIGAVIILVIGYALGVMFPGIGAGVKAKISGATGG